jgi:hypothetical protein
MSSMKRLAKKRHIESPDPDIDHDSDHGTALSGDGLGHESGVSSAVASPAAAARKRNAARVQPQA